MSLHNTLLSADRSALFVVDPQERLMAAIYEADRVVRNTSLLVHCAKALGMPVMASTQYKKGLGPLVPELAGLLADDPSIDKVEFNAFACSGTARILERFPSRVDTLILAGAEAHICIYQTAVGAVAAGYRVWVAADAVSSRKKENAELALARMQALGIDVGPTEMAVYELLQRAGTGAFKAMLPHLK